MKNSMLFIGVFGILGLSILLKSARKPTIIDDSYIVVAWNDLGMHCTNIDFSGFVVLPPYNNLHAQVIKRGSPYRLPEIITQGVSLTYEIPGNTVSSSKTNFWDFDEALFGVDLPLDTGLTGIGLSGSMTIHNDYFAAEGIPITPFPDTNLTQEDPYQLALVKLFDADGNLLQTTQPVIPVSGEIGCVQSGCHASANDILEEHPSVDGLVNPANAPILCASCHATNALGTTGDHGAEIFSQVIHKKHEFISDCYQCHPGNDAQCHRGVMYDNGGPDGLICQDCHGDTEEVGHSIEEGRQDWLEEPRCGSTSCHGSNYAEESGKLYRNSKGHGGLYCTVCHGSPHAILPSSKHRDNIQNIEIQGFAGTLQDCRVCHGYIPEALGPHGYHPGLPECVDTIHVTTGINSDSSIIGKYIFATDSVFSPSHVIFESRYGTTFKDGFYIEQGAVVEVWIIPCDSTSN